MDRTPSGGHFAIRIAAVASPVRNGQLLPDYGRRSVRLTSVMNVWYDDAHGTAIEHPLDEPITTRMIYTNKWCHTSKQGCGAEVVGSFDAQA